MIRIHPKAKRAVWPLVAFVFALAFAQQASAHTTTATASSQLVALEAPNAADGDDQTFWSSNGHATTTHTEWIQFDFDETIVLDGVTLTPRIFASRTLAFPRDYHIEYSYDNAGAHWFAVPGQFHEDVTTPTAAVTHTFPGVVIARRIRVTATALGNDDFGFFYFQLAEFEAIESSWTPPFETSVGGDFDARLNMMWSIFGAMNDGSYYDAFSQQPDDPWDSGVGSVFAFGGGPTWHEWMALKYCWSATTADKADFLRNVVLIPPAQSFDGYMWSWPPLHEEWPRGPTGPEGAWHQENNAKHILGCWRYWAWSRDDAFLTAMDNDQVTAPTRPSRPDVSQGMTLQQKLRLAMQYLEIELQGNLGGITIEDNGVGTTGTVTSDPTNYWDNWRFGYKNAYDNIYYYPALEAMAQLEEHWGDDARAAQLRGYAAGCKAEYDSIFWDDTKGRFIGCIDKNGVTHDYGFTFLNVEALSYGLGDATKAARIFDWLDGNVTIAGDTSTGADIYHWGFAPRSNTMAAEAIGPPYWWEDLDGAIEVNVPGEASFGAHLENGGAIMYVSAYDIFARLGYLGPDAALARLEGILDEFQVDQLRRDPLAPAGPTWVLGTIGEFPTSGMVPTVMVYGFAGIGADISGLRIAPNLPTGWTRLKINQVTYAGTILDIEIRPTDITIESHASSSRTLYSGADPLAPGGSLTAPYTPGNPVLLGLTAIDPTAVDHWTLF